MKDNDNLTIERPTFVTHLECAMEGDHYAADQVHNLSKAGKPLLVRYDLAGVKKALTKEALAERPADLWRYRELLPVRKCQDIVSLGEVTTPLIRLPKLSARLGGGEIIVKDEGRLPTGSFKARGLVMAGSMGKALGMTIVAEGVETADQLEYLRQTSCDEVQGYLIGRPAPIGQFAALVGGDRLAETVRKAG